MKNLRISRTVEPEGRESLSFNQIQAIQLLERTGDIGKFNSYCASVGMTREDKSEARSQVKIK